MPVPMIDDLELKAVQTIRQEVEQGWVRQRIAGLDGTLHQKIGRKSHRVAVSGLLIGETAADDLATLQEKSASGAEVSFTADITTALTVEKMVIESFVAEQRVGGSSQFSFSILLSESPPLPPPAEVSSFGGLGDFGIGDLGFDELGGLLDEISEQAGALAEMADAALSAVEQLASLAALGDLGNIGNPLKPVTDRVAELGDIGPAVGDLLGNLGNLTS